MVRLQPNFTEHEIAELQEMAAEAGVFHDGTPAPTTFITIEIRKLIAKWRTEQEPKYGTATK